jgi:hypothetical protein
LAPPRAGIEGALADSILVSGGYRQHDLPAGAMLADLPLAQGEVHVLMDGLLIIEIDGEPAVEAGPGAIFDPAVRTAESKERVTIRAETRCRLAVMPRDRLDDQALLGVAAQQAGRLRDHADG